MGALPRLKIKDEIKYRPGSTNEAHNCKNCHNFKRDFLTIRRADGVVSEHRCAIISVREGARYRIKENYTCDRQVMSQEYLDTIEQYRNSGHPTIGKEA